MFSVSVKLGQPHQLHHWKRVSWEDGLSTSPKEMIEFFFSVNFAFQLICPQNSSLPLRTHTSCLFLMTHFWETAPESTICDFIHKGQSRQLHPAHMKQGENPIWVQASHCHLALFPPSLSPPYRCQGNTPRELGPDLLFLSPCFCLPLLCLDERLTHSRWCLGALIDWEFLGFHLGHLQVGWLGRTAPHGLLLCFWREVPCKRVGECRPWSSHCLGIVFLFLIFVLPSHIFHKLKNVKGTFSSHHLYSWKHFDFLVCLVQGLIFLLVNFLVMFLAVMLLLS